jgi:hypothetical protein
MSNALSDGMMYGFITEIDFELCDEAFPGIVRYYRELKDKPRTFLELFWAYTHSSCSMSEPCPVANLPASSAVSR